MVGFIQTRFSEYARYFSGLLQSKIVIDGLEEDEVDGAFQLSHRGRDPLLFKADKESIADRWIEAFSIAITLEE